MKLTFVAPCLVLVMAATIPLVSQVNPYKDGTPGVTGYRSEVLAEVIVQEDKFLRLAEAIRADKYNWRPSADVRSFCRGLPPRQCGELQLLQARRNSAPVRHRS